VLDWIGKPIFSLHVSGTSTTLAAIAERKKHKRTQSCTEKNPNVCQGKACIRGTRVMVSVIPDNLAAGIPEPEILKSYLTVSSDDVRAAISLLA
jgi:uncharacterized protein (DUF433 family)